MKPHFKKARQPQLLRGGAGVYQGTRSGSAPVVRGLTEHRRARRNLRGRRSIANPVTKRYQALGGAVTASSAGAICNRRANRQSLALKRVGAPNVIIDQSTNLITIAAGFQGIAYDYINNVGYLNSIQSKLPANNALSGGSPPTRFMLESTTALYSMTNTTTASLEVEIFDIMSKRDVLSQWTYSTNQKSSPVTFVLDGNPKDYWNIGALLGTNENVTPPQPSTILGSTPYDSQLFRDYWVVKRRTKVLLPMGASHKHTVSTRPNLMVDEALTASWAYVNSLKGITCFTMFVAKGMPQTCGSESPVIVTTSNGELAIVKSYRTKYTWVSDTSNNLYYNDNLTSPASTQVVNIGSGQPEAVRTTA